ncbi:MAG: hypothetical protein R2862_02720 [Thermoanaerobaculia bacterium]
MPSSRPSPSPPHRAGPNPGDGGERCRKSIARRAGARLPPVTPLPWPETARPPTQKPKWSFELPRVHATALPPGQLDGARYSSRFAARGSMTLAATPPKLEVAPSHLDPRRRQTHVNDTVIGHGLGGSRRCADRALSFRASEAEVR